MDYRYKQLEQELSALSKVFSDLGVRLSEVAKEVTSPGVMPSEKLLEQISASRTNFENCRTAIHGHAGAMLVSPLPKVGELVSITTIDALLKASAAAEETKFSVENERAKALEILGRVLAITHREAADFKPLQECHAKLGELRSAISNVLWPHRHPESESIVASKHPATALLAFVETLDTLEDEKWMALETTISDTYGKPLFVAASRGKLTVAAESKSESKPVAATPPAAKAPVVAPPEPPKPVAAEKPVVAAPEPPKPAVAAEKPVEKPVERKLVVEKAPEKPAPAPVPAAPVVAAPAPVMEKKIPAPPIPAAPAPAAVGSVAVAVAAEKKEVAQDKIPQKPTTPPATTPAPVTPAAATPTPAAAVPPAPVASPEKKDVVEKPHQPAAGPVSPVAPTVAIPVAPVPTAPHAVASVSTPAPAAPVPPAPVAVTPAAPSRPAPAAVAPTAAAPVAAAPAAVPSAPPVAANSHATPQASLSALATATESVSEKRPTASAAVETVDKQRKEPRLAAPAPQPVAAKAEVSNEEFAADEAQKAAAGDPSQRPQRWGFWRGNR